MTLLIAKMKKWVIYDLFFLLNIVYSGNVARNQFL